MKKRFLPVLLVLLQLLVILPAVVTGQNQGAASQAQARSAFSQQLNLLKEVWTRRITLEFLADKRTDALLSQLLADFPRNIKQNFVNNIRGDNRIEFYANYAAKAEEVTNHAFELMRDEPAFDNLLGTEIRKEQFPYELGYLDLVKKIMDHRKWELSNGNSQRQKLYDYWKSVYDSMRGNARRDRFELLAKNYNKIEIRDFPIHWYDDAQHIVAFETIGANPEAPKPLERKKWTVLVFICADNDLERFGLSDLNDMERIGSSKDVNIVAQFDRMKDGHRGATTADGNWTGTRRYYVEKDNDPKKINSPMVMNLGETDMGNKHTLADFLKWGAETYPADNFLVVVWNHGMGWKGIAHDEQSDQYMYIEDVAWALREGQKVLTKVNKKPSKFSVVDFDACLMGTIEVAYEIADSTEFMVASQENEPGGGMPYADYLEPLVRNPNLSPREFTKRMVGTYVHSYAKGGSQTSAVWTGSAVTKSAVDLGKVNTLVQMFDRLGHALLTNHEKYAELLISDYGTFAAIRRYSDDTLVDLVDLVVRMSQIPNLPSEIRALCHDIIKLVGYPVENDRLSKPVTIVSDKPGSVVWGYNDWRMPPRELWPASTRVFNSRLALTTLRKQRNGKYVTSIGPFKPVIDESLQKSVFVDEINYQIIRDDGRAMEKRRVRQGKEYLIVSKFPPQSPIVIEGHTQGMGDSRGLSIYFSPAYKFTTRYNALRFAKETSWGQFLQKIPEFQRKADILLTGQMVNDPMTYPLMAEALKANNVQFQVLWDPSVFAYNFKGILQKFAKGGLVITDGVSLNSLGQLSPSSDDLQDYLNRGGNLLIANQSFEQSNLHQNLLQNYFKFSYQKDLREFGDLICNAKSGDFTFSLNGDGASRTADKVTLMRAGNPASLFIRTPNDQGAGIYIADRNYAAIYLGFRFEAVSNTENRHRLMGEILDRLYPQRHQMSLFD